MTTDATIDLEFRRRQTRRNVRSWSAARSWLSVLVVVTLLVVACSSEDPPRVYSDDEIDLDELVRGDLVLRSLPYSRYRTGQEIDRAFPDFATSSGHERERNFFEFLVGLKMLEASESLPPDVASASSVLHEAEEAALDDCAADAGYPGVQLYDVSQQMGEQYERNYGLTLEMFLDLRHECSQRAATYPTLDPQVRDELLAKEMAHYMKAVKDWMAANPELVVPIEYHEGANTPYADRFADS